MKQYSFLFESNDFLQEVIDQAKLNQHRANQAAAAQRDARNYGGKYGTQARQVNAQRGPKAGDSGLIANAQTIQQKREAMTPQAPLKNSKGIINLRVKNAQASAQAQQNISRQNYDAKTGYMKAPTLPNGAPNTSASKPQPNKAPNPKPAAGGAGGGGTPPGNNNTPAPNPNPAAGGGTPPTPQQPAANQNPAPTSGIGAKAGEVAGRTAQRAGGWLRNAGNRFMNSPGKMGALAGMGIGMYNAWKNGKSMLNPWTWIKGAATGAVLGKVGGAVANMGRQSQA